MGRPLEVHHPLFSSSSTTTTTTTVLLVVASIAAVASIVISLCATRKHPKLAKNSESNSIISPLAGDKKLLSSLSSKALAATAKMVTWKPMAGENDEKALWKKSIIMGDKCRPLDFSGQIIYDEEGNLLPEIDPRAVALFVRKG